MGPNLTLVTISAEWRARMTVDLCNYVIRPLCYMQNTQASFVTCKLPTSFLKDKNSQQAFTLRENKAVQGHCLVRPMYYGLHLSQPYPNTLYPLLSSEPDFSLYKKMHGFALPTHPSITVGFSALCLCTTRKCLPHKTKEIILQMSQCTFRNGPQ